MQANLTTIFLLAVASAIAIDAAVLPRSKGQGIRERKGFRLLGTLQKPRTITKFGITSQVYEDWNYWESVNAAGYAEAARDCRENGDTLLYLETREEVENVTRWLQDTDNTGSLYWIGGRYDTITAGFIWENGVPLSPEAPWGAGQPRDKKNNSRVAASTIGREIELETQASTVTSRYICEGEMADDGEEEQIPEPCFKDNDLVIVIDSSSSILPDDYEIAKEFASRLATTWVDHTGSRVAVQIYSHIAMAIFNLTDDQSVSAIKEKVYNMPHIKSETHSYAGIDLATEQIQDNDRGVLKNLVFLTDGVTYPYELKPRTEESAARANNLGIRTFSVGIGDVDDDELLIIAGGNSDRVFNRDQFGELLAVLRPLSRKVCE